MKIKLIVTAYIEKKMILTSYGSKLKIFLGQFLYFENDFWVHSNGVKSLKSTVVTFLRYSIS